MSQFIVEGRHALNGSIEVCGNKNEALPCIAAALACKDRVVLRNLPAIGDVQAMLQIARSLGVEVSPLQTGCCTIQPGTLRSSELPMELAARIRGSILFASALLVRTGMAILPQPGGDTIGRRRIDSHLLVFKSLGAQISTRRETLDNGSEQLTFVIAAPRGLKGGTIFLDEASVTATENAIIAATGARATTTIVNAACEPHVQGLCRFFQATGVRIEGIGSNILTISGKPQAGMIEHAIGCDYIEAGSFIAAAATTGSRLEITGIEASVMRMIIYQFERLGVKTRLDAAGSSIEVAPRQKLRIRQDLGGAIPKIEDSPWPAFPADLTSIMVVMATQCHGTCLIHEKMFESRLFFVDKLIGMGARIVLCDPHRAVVAGPSPLYGATIISPDIRAGMALLIAALAAEGSSTINNIEQIDRGYQNIDGRLATLGARITRINDRRGKR